MGISLATPRSRFPWKSAYGSTSAIRDHTSQEPGNRVAWGHRQETTCHQAGPPPNCSASPGHTSRCTARLLAYRHRQETTCHQAGHLPRHPPQWDITYLPVVPSVRLPVLKVHIRTQLARSRASTQIQGTTCHRTPPVSRLHARPEHTNPPTARLLA